MFSSRWIYTLRYAAGVDGGAWTWICQNLPFGLGECLNPSTYTALPLGYFYLTSLKGGPDPHLSAYLGLPHPVFSIWNRKIPKLAPPAFDKFQWFLRLSWSIPSRSTYLRRINYQNIVMFERSSRSSQLWKPCFSLASTILAGWSGRIFVTGSC